MPTSQNGYSANDRSLIASFVVPGTSRKLALRKGDCAVVLLDFAAWFHREIEPIDTGSLDDWGYAERMVRGSSTTLSNHASGTGMDLNAPRHPLGRVGTFTAAQTAKIRAKLKEYGGVIRWGGDYVNRKDEMHFEINKGIAAVKAVADRIRARSKPAQPPVKVAPAPVKKAAPRPAPARSNPYKTPVLTAGRPSLTAAGKKTKAEVQWVQWAVGAVTDGSWGAQTTASVKAWQKKNGLVTDANVGPKTLAKMKTVRR